MTHAEVHTALERAVEVLRQLEVFDDITALIGAEPLVRSLDGGRLCGASCRYSVCFGSGGARRCVCVCVCVAPSGVSGVQHC
jgi:hypothetical protein